MGLALSAVALYILVGVFSSGTESNARWKILIISIGSLVVEVLVLRLSPIPSLTWVAIALIAAVVFIVASLILWCGVERKAAMKIAVSYLGISVGLTLLTGLLQRH